MKVERNGVIDFWRFVFTVMVAVLHFDKTLIGGGYLAVEFFFITSGFFLYKTFSKSRYNPGVFIKKRISQLYPLYIIGLLSRIIYFTAGLVLQYGFAIETINQVMNYWLGEVFELTMTQMFGYGYYWTNFTLWYISVILICSYLLYNMLYYINEKYISAILFVICITSYTLVLINGGELGLDYYINFIGMFRSGVIRGAASMTAGMLICMHLPDILNMIEKVRKSIINIAIIADAFVILYCIYVTYNTNMDMVFVYALLALMILSNMKLGINRGMDIIGNKINMYLGSNITYAMYVLSIVINNLYIKILTRLNVNIGIELSCTIYIYLY